MRDDFAAFILTHGRPDNVLTLRFLETGGYTGRVFLVIDDEDPAGPEYRDRYGDRVLTFSKDEVDPLFDRYDNSPDRRSVVWARNACWGLARQVAARYFVQLDDDYYDPKFRRCGVRGGGSEPTYHGWTIRTTLDDVFEAMIRFIAGTPAVTIAMSQGGDHIGGEGNANAATRLIRKAMNSFVCDAERPFRFVGRLNDDVNTYVTHGALGVLMFTHTDLQLDQLPTQSNPGGLTDLYADSGTYVKSFYTVIAAPSCVTVRTMGRHNLRWHHAVNWRHAVPKILHERHRKA